MPPLPPTADRRTAGPSAAPSPCALQAGSKDASKLDTLFNMYKDKSSEEDVIGPEGALPPAALLSCCVPAQPPGGRHAPACANRFKRKSCLEPCLQAWRSCART